MVSLQVEFAVLRRRTLLKRLQDVTLSPEEAQALRHRVETNTCSTEDRDRLAQVIRATTQVSDQLLAPSPLPEQASHGRPSPERTAKRKRQLDMGGMVSKSDTDRVSAMLPYA